MTELEQRVFASAFAMAFGNFAHGGSSPREAGKMAMTYSLHAVIALREAADAGLSGVRPESARILEFVRKRVKAPEPDAGEQGGGGNGGEQVN